MDMTKLVARVEGLPIGISAGGAVFAATEVAKRKDFTNKRIVVILPDSIERYLTIDDI